MVAVSALHQVRCTLNEVELTVLRAARGQRLHEGLSEELSRAASWLCRVGFYGLTEARGALEAGPSWSVAESKRMHRTWSFCEARSALVGPSVFELLSAAAADEVRVCGLDRPMLLLGYPGVAAQNYGLTFRLSTPCGGACVVAARGVRSAGVGSAGGVPVPVGAVQFEGGEVRVERADAGGRAASFPRTVDGVYVDPEALRILSEYAALTYLPASTLSRETGAGAGLTDQDPASL